LNTLLTGRIKSKAVTLLIEMMITISKAKVDDIPFIEELTGS